MNNFKKRRLNTSTLRLRSAASFFFVPIRVSKDPFGCSRLS